MGDRPLWAENTPGGILAYFNFMELMIFGRDSSLDFVIENTGAIFTNHEAFTQHDFIDDLGAKLDLTSTAIFPVDFYQGQTFFLF